MYIDGRSEDKRKRRDGLVGMLVWLGVLGWLMLFAAAILIDRARPDDTRFAIDRKIYEQSGVEYNLRTSWDAGLTDYILYLLIGALALSVIGFILNTMRHRRKDDRYHMNVILLFLAALAGISWYGMYLM